MTGHQRTILRDDATAPAGLCAACIHAQTIPSSKGSEFVLCLMSFNDSRFPRYPRLPVLACSGYTPRTSDTASVAQENK